MSVMRVPIRRREGMLTGRGAGSVRGSNQLARCFPAGRCDPAGGS